jgi:hypothetical protein
MNFKPKFVIAIPITRDNANSIELCKVLVEMLERGQLHKLIVIDKTKSKRPLALISKMTKSPKISYFQEEKNETLFETMAKIQLDRGEWIAQVHDDDLVSGEIYFDNSVGELVTIMPLVKSGNGKKYDSIPLKRLVYWPLSSLISFTPWTVWNIFVEYLRAQGRSVSAGADFSFNRISQQIMSVMEMKSYTYFYNNQRWSSKNLTKKSIRDVMQRDGLPEFVDNHFFEIMQFIDCLALALWFERHLPNIKDSQLSDSAYDAICQSFRKHFVIKLKYIYVSLLLMICLRLSFIIKLRSFLDQQKSKQVILLKLIDIQKSKDSHDIAREILGVSQLPEFNLIKKRLNFFAAEILAVSPKYKME